MATIEERAKAWNAESARHHFTDLDDWQCGYVQGANEQKQIDIDKACDFFCKKVCRFCSGDSPCKKVDDFRELLSNE